MKSITTRHKKSEKGNVLTFFGLASAILTVMLGLAFQPVKSNLSYPAPETLQQAVNAAALAASGEFKPPHYVISDMETAAQSALDTYNIQPQSLTVETCDTTGDPALCAAPLKKLVRVRVTALVAPDGLPSTVTATAEAPSLDVVLVIDTSDSMTYDAADGTANQDPHVCNVGFQCHPMEEVKSAAKAFVDQMYPPYDRVGVVYFHKSADVDLALSDNTSVIKDRISNLQVYEGEFSQLANGTWHGTSCIYYLDDPAINYDNRWDPANASPPLPSPPNTIPYANDPLPYGPCRAKIFSDSSFAYQFDCPLNFGPNGDPSRCGRSNIAGGINVATRALLGTYPATYTDLIPTLREDSTHVLILLSDGIATAGYAENGDPICPVATRHVSYGKYCRDTDSTSGTRHSSTDPDYDVDDQAHDMFDTANSNNITIYTVGLGDAVILIPSGNTGPAPGETLLKYPETVLGNGKFYYAPSGNYLNPIFLDIANKLLSPVTQPIVTPTVTPTTVTSTVSPTVTPLTTSTPTVYVTKTPTAACTNTVTPTRTMVHEMGIRTFTTFSSLPCAGTVTPTPTTTSTPTVLVTETPTAACTNTVTPTRTPISESQGFITTFSSLPCAGTVTPTATQTRTPTSITLTLNSIAAQDGWVLESSETSGVGGTTNTTNVLRLGDSAARQQYRSILSFNTANLPNTAIITSVMLKFTKYGVIGGGSPMAIFNGMLIDIKTGFFGTSSVLQQTDFQAIASKTYGPASPLPVSGFYQINLTNSKSYINKLNTNGGLTQLRLRFKLDDNNDTLANYLNLYSGDTPAATYRPQLVITYHMP